MKNETVIRNLFDAASEFIGQGFINLKAHDPMGYEKLSMAVEAGILLSLQIDFGKGGVSKTHCYANIENETVELFQIDAVNPIWN